MTEISRKVITERTEEGSYIVLVTFTSAEVPTLEEIREDFSTHCTHTHDCCGGRYYRANYCTLVCLDRGLFSVEVSSYLNI